jgi:hypothetical protein
MLSRLCSKRWKAGSLPSNLLVVLERQGTSGHLNRDDENVRKRSIQHIFTAL